MVIQKVVVLVNENKRDSNKIIQKRKIKMSSFLLLPSSGAVVSLTLPSLTGTSLVPVQSRRRTARSTEPLWRRVKGGCVLHKFLPRSILRPFRVPATRGRPGTHCTPASSARFCGKWALHLREMGRKSREGERSGEMKEHGPGQVAFVSMPPQTPLPLPKLPRL